MDSSVGQGLPITIERLKEQKKRYEQEWHNAAEWRRRIIMKQVRDIQARIDTLSNLMEDKNDAQEC